MNHNRASNNLLEGLRTSTEDGDLCSCVLIAIVSDEGTYCPYTMCPCQDIARPRYCMSGCEDDGCVKDDDSHVLCLASQSMSYSYHHMTGLATRFKPAQDHAVQTRWQGTSQSVWPTITAATESSLSTRRYEPHM